MKRLIAVLVVVALVMTGAFAQISFSGWGRGMFVPVQVAPGEEVKDATTAVEASWGGAPRIGFTIRGTSDNIGFQVDMLGDTNAVKDPTNSDEELGTFISVGDNAFIYWANDMFKVSIGKVQGDTLRGKFDDVPLGGIIFGWRNKNKDDIFTRFYPKCGALVEARPVDGLYIGAAVEGNTSAKESYKDTIQVGAGYTGDFGMVRAQYVGKSQGERVELAFAPSLDGVALDVGFKYPIDELGYKAQVAVGSAFNIDAVAVTARADVKIADTTNAQFYAIPSMGFDFGTLGLDAVVDVNFGDETVVGFGVAPWYSKGYSNGYIKAAFAVSKATAKDAKLGWAVPVIFEYWF